MILQRVPDRSLQYAHTSPLSGLPDAPGHYRTVTVEPSDDDGRTRISLVQDNTPDCPGARPGEKNGATVLDGLKRLLEP